jgi:hypothetical protein
VPCDPRRRGSVFFGDRLVDVNVIESENFFCRGISLGRGGRYWIMKNHSFLKTLEIFDGIKNKGNES